MADHDGPGGRAAGATRRAAGRSADRARRRADQVLRDVLPFAQYGHHPRFFARIPGPSNPIGVLADALAIGHNAVVGSWTGGSSAATIELIMLGWLAELFGLPDDSDGAFVSGGSVAPWSTSSTRRMPRSRARSGCSASMTRVCACSHPAAIYHWGRTGSR